MQYKYMYILNFNPIFAIFIFLNPFATFAIARYLSLPLNPMVVSIFFAGVISPWLLPFGKSSASIWCIPKRDRIILISVSLLIFAFFYSCFMGFVQTFLYDVPINYPIVLSAIVLCFLFLSLRILIECRFGLDGRVLGFAPVGFLIYSIFNWKSPLSFSAINLSMIFIICCTLIFLSVNANISSIVRRTEGV